MNEASQLTIYITENIRLSGAPRAGDWWEDSESTSSQQGGEEDVDSCSVPDGQPRRFKNCGLETWHQVRDAWNVPIEGQQKMLPPTPSKSVRREIIKGLQTNRCFELKQKMSLTDMVKTYNELWFAEE
jgi:hypothetical protein